MGGATSYSGGGQVLIGMVVLIVGPLLIRIYCELAIVFFRMSETLSEIKKVILEQGEFRPGKTSGEISLKRLI